MGREVRRVPPNWEHPKSAERGDLQPMFDKEYTKARDEWIAGLLAHKREDHDGSDYWEWEGNPPDREYYRPWKDEESTWFQLWETVSEGTPVSPPFATPEELAQYLAEHGDFWDEHRGDGGWGIERARAFVAAGWAPSMMISGGKILESKDIPAAMAKEKTHGND